MDLYGLLCQMIGKPLNESDVDKLFRIFLSGFSVFSMVCYYFSLSIQKIFSKSPNDYMRVMHIHKVCVDLLWVYNVYISVDRLWHIPSISIHPKILFTTSTSTNVDIINHFVNQTWAYNKRREREHTIIAIVCYMHACSMSIQDA